MEPVDVYADKERARTRDLLSSASRLRYGTKQPIPPSSFNQAWSRVTDRYNRALSKIVPVSPAAANPQQQANAARLAGVDADPMTQRLAGFDSIKKPDNTPVREADIYQANPHDPTGAIIGNALSGNRFVRTLTGGHVNLEDLPGPLSTVTDVALAPATLLSAGAGGAGASGGRAIAGAIFKRGVEETAAGVAGLEAQKEADKLPEPLRTPVAIGAGLLAAKKSPRIFGNGAANLAARAAVGTATGLATREAPGAVAGLAAGAGAFKGAKAITDSVANPAVRRAVGQGVRAGVLAPGTLSTSMIHVDDPHFASYEDALARHHIEYRIGDDGTIEVADPDAAERVIANLEEKGMTAMQGTRIPGGQGKSYQPPFGSREREAMDANKMVQANRRSIEGGGGAGKATMPGTLESGLPDPLDAEAYRGLDDSQRIAEVLDPESYPDTAVAEGRRTPIAEGARPLPAEPITPESIGKKRASPKDLAAIQAGVDEADAWLRDNVLTPEYTPRTAASAIQAEIDRRGFLVGRETRKKPLTNTELAFRRRLTEVADHLDSAGHEGYTVGDELPRRADAGNIPVAETVPGAEGAGGSVAGEAGSGAGGEPPPDAASSTVKRVDLSGNVTDTFQTEAELNGIRAQQGAMDLEGRNAAGALNVPRPSMPERPAFQLPSELAGAKPSYSYGPKRFKLQFEDEADKALYIVATSAQDSKRHADYLAALTGYFPDRTPQEIRQLGDAVKARIKTLAKGAPAGNLRVVKSVHELGAVEGLGPGERAARGADAVFGEPAASGANTPPAAPAAPPTEPPPPPEVGPGNPQRAFGQTDEEPVDLLATRPVDELLANKKPYTEPESRFGRGTDRIRRFGAGVAKGTNGSITEPRVQVAEAEKSRMSQLIKDLVAKKKDELMARARDAGLEFHAPTDPTENGWQIQAGGQSASVRDVVEGATPAGKAVRAALTPEQQAVLDDATGFLNRANATKEFHGGEVAKVTTETGDYWPSKVIGKRTQGGFVEKTSGGGKGRNLRDSRGGARTQSTQEAGELQGNVYSNPWDAWEAGATNKLMDAADSRLADIIKPLAVDAQPGFDVATLKGNHPLLSKKQVTGTGEGGAAFLVDKPLAFPSDIASQIDAVLTPTSIADSAPGKAFNAVNAVATPLRAAADISSRLNQGLGFIESSPRNAVKAMTGGTKVLWSALGHPEAYDNLMRGEVGRTRALLGQAGITGPAADEWMVQRGIHYSGSGTVEDFVFPKGLEAVPGVGKVIRFSNDDFQRFTNYARSTLANDALERALGQGLKGEALNRAAEGAFKSVNRMTGWTATKTSGLENIALFAPRFFRSGVEQVVAAATKGGLEGSIARRHMAKLFGVAAGLSYAANKVRGYDTDFDPTSPNFLAIRNVGGLDIKPLGSSATLTAGVANLVGGDLSSVIDLKGPSFARAKSSPIISTLWTWASGTTYTNRPVEQNPTNKGFLTSTLPQVATESIPFAAQNAIQSDLPAAVRDGDVGAIGTGLLGAGLSGVGAQASELTPAEKRDFARETVAKELFGSSYADLAGADKAKVNADGRVERNQREVTRRGLESGDKRTAVEQDYRSKLTASAGFLSAGKDASGKPFGGVDYRKSVDDASAARSSGLKALGVSGGDDLVSQYFGLRDKATMANGEVDYDTLDRMQAEFTAAHPDVLDQIDKATGTQDDPTMQSLRVARKQAQEYYQIPAFRGLSLEEGDRASAVIAQAKALTSAGQAPTARVAYGMLMESGDATEEDVRLAIIASRAGSNIERKQYRVSHPEFARFYYNAADDLPQTFTAPARTSGSSRTPTSGSRTSTSRIRQPGRVATTGPTANRVRQPGR